MGELLFDIFAGEQEKNAVWLEAVEGLSNARARMHDLAAQKPGRYFVFSSHSHTVIVMTETFPKPSSKTNAA